MRPVNLQLACESTTTIAPKSPWIWFCSAQRVFLAVRCVRCVRIDEVLFSHGPFVILQFQFEFQFEIVEGNLVSLETFPSVSVSLPGVLRGRMEV